MRTAKIPNFFQDKPLFGLDIGHGSVKVMQMTDESANAKSHGSNPQIKGYGFTFFDKSAQEDGVVVKPEIIAQTTLDLFKNTLVGRVDTKRVAMSIPAYRTFTRALQLPKLKPRELKESAQLEAEQYIPVALDDLYLDYEIVKETDEGYELFLVAVPREIVDSYIDLAQIMGLETVLIEPTLSSSARLFSADKNSNIASCIIDFGSLSSDISLFDQHMLVSGTVQGGGEIFTNIIQDKLKVSPEEAALIKTKYGLGMSKRQKEVIQALEPSLGEIIKEVRRMIRYYEERYGTDRPIGQIVTTGGGANVPGLSDYLTTELRLAVRHMDPWQFLSFKGLQPPSNADKPMYATVAGLSLSDPKEVFKV